MRSASHFLRSGALAVALLLPFASVAKISTQTPPGWPKPKESTPIDAPKVKIDGRLAEYRRVEKLDGKIRSVGSSTLSNLINRWAESFKLLYPVSTSILPAVDRESQSQPCWKTARI